MKAGYKVENGKNWSEQKFFIASNYHHMNFIKIYGFSNMPKKSEYDIGVWKIKQLKN
jgi:hypothetical protein